MINRREILGALAAAAVSGAPASVLARQLAAQATGHGSAIQLGAQTNAWAIDPKNPDSFFAVLGQIRQLGYAGFETGFFNLIDQFGSPDEARRRIAASGLAFVGIHIAIPFAKCDPETHLPPVSLYERVTHGGKALGAQRLIFSGAPSITVADVDKKIEGLNAAGKFAHSLGLGFAYHNHWWEFQSKVGEVEALYANTDPAAVSFLLDAGHAYRGGADVPAFLRKHSSRIVALHVRDYKDGKQVPLGSGNFPLATVAETLKALKWQGWALNEEEREDGTKGGLTVIEPAYKALRGAFSA
ncbi:MAG: sugar phosphate isomerase/epimerase [Terracidiphilus sp.]|nr:sugar phosphate isomerase/epimerase [Terracidiphilus sp.]